MIASIVHCCTAVVCIVHCALHSIGLHLLTDFDRRLAARSLSVASRSTFPFLPQPVFLLVMMGMMTMMTLMIVMANGIRVHLPTYPSASSHLDPTFLLHN